MRLAVVTSFLNEAQYLPALLESIRAQERLPDELLLVDDGSSDASFRIASDFAEGVAGARALRRPPRSPEADRLATAAELRAFLWAVEQLEPGWDVVVKLDADLRLNRAHFAQLVRAFEADATLGIGGSYLAVETAEGPRREHQPAYHVRGPNKFYRRACFEAIAPLPPILGWDTIDEIAARMHGWTVRSIELPGGDSIHLRPTGLHDGRLRAMRRWGECAWGYGATPATILAGAARRARRPPWGVAAAHYVYGYAAAAASRKPRARPELLAHSRREQRARIQRGLGRLRLGAASLSRARSAQEDR